MPQDLETPATSAAVLPNVATIAKSASVTPIGVDIGNGSLKLVSNQGETHIDSYIHYLADRASMSVNSGYVEYHSGDRSDLVGKQWVDGINAYSFDPKGMYRVTDTPIGKADLGLQILLSGLSMLPYRAVPQSGGEALWNLHLVCSIHDGETLGAKLKSALQRTHHTLMNFLRDLGRAAAIGCRNS